MKAFLSPAVGVLLLGLAAGLFAEVCNITVVSDSRPDFTNMDRFLESVTAPYDSTDAKTKAIWRWLTRCRRQTAHPTVHGTPVHDPIMFFNDFGYSFCSDYAGMNCAIWHSMGLPVKFWDIANHTVSECFYDSRWHMFDNSMSAYYTLCDRMTVAGVEDIGKPGACELSHGQTEDAHIALVHCVAATSPHGFLTGADTQRSLGEEGLHCFNPKALKYRSYYNGFELGHRYVLNLRPNETYTRHGAPLGATAEFYLPLDGDKSPQGLGTFGNGLWVYAPDLTKENVLDDLYEGANLAAGANGLRAKDPNRPAEAVLLVNGANIVTSAKALLSFDLPDGGAACSLALSTDHGHSWTDLWRSDGKTASTAEVPLKGVAANHQFLVKVALTGRAVLKSIELATVTQLNKLTLPILTLGRNTIDVTVGEPAETFLYWPELQNNAFQHACLSSNNVESGEASDWHGCLWLAAPGTGDLTYEVTPRGGDLAPYRLVADAGTGPMNGAAARQKRLRLPGEMAELTYGGRFYNRAPGSSISLSHSLDDGKTWVSSWTLTDTESPWDVVHFETVTPPAGTPRVLVRYSLTSKAAGTYSACSLYSVRMTAKYRPANVEFQPLEVTYNWSELQEGSWVERSHTQLITKPQERYFLSVGGDDLPRTNWVRVNLKGAVPNVTYGYSDGKDSPRRTEPFVRKRHVWGKDVAAGKPYTFSIPSGNNWDAGDPEMTKLTDGAIASTYGGGTTYREGPIWTPGQNPTITLDLQEPQKVAAVRIHVTGYPYDFYNGPFSEVEVLTSIDGESFVSQGTILTAMKYKDVDGDFVLPERGGFESWVFPLILQQPLEVRYVRYKVTNRKMFFSTSEVLVYGSVQVDDWHEPLAMPLGAAK